MPVPVSSTSPAAYTSPLPSVATAWAISPLFEAVPLPLKIHLSSPVIAASLATVKSNAVGNAGLFCGLTIVPAATTSPMGSSVSASALPLPTVLGSSRVHTGCPSFAPSRATKKLVRRSFGTGFSPATNTSPDDPTRTAATRSFGGDPADVAQRTWPDPPASLAVTPSRSPAPFTMNPPTTTSSSGVIATSRPSASPVSWGPTSVLQSSCPSMAARRTTTTCWTEPKPSERGSVRCPTATTSPSPAATSRRAAFDTLIPLAPPRIPARQSSRPSAASRHTTAKA